MGDLASAYEEGVYAKELSARVVPGLDPVLDILNERRVEFAGGRDGIGRRLLDIGSGKGRLLRAAQHLGYDVTGVEPHSNRSTFAKTEYGVPVFQGRLEDFPAEGSPFDVVTMWHVLEHVPDPVAFLRTAHSLLGEGGVLVLEVPSYKTYSATVSGRHWQGWQLPYHLSHFTLEGVHHMLAETGFLVIE